MIKPKYRYEIYSPSGTYLGILQNVTSPFQTNQAIATAFTQLNITVAQSADTASLKPDPILDEANLPILDETGDELLAERQADLVGDNTANILINEDNIVKVWEFSQYAINGTVVFLGYISKWKAIYGSTDDIVITCLSDGTDLQQYLVETGDTAYISETTDNGTYHSIGLTSAKAGSFDSVAEIFNVYRNVKAGGISVEVTTPESGVLSISIYQMLGGTPDPQGDTLIASGSTVAAALATKTVLKVSFDTHPTLTSGITYYFLVEWSNDSGSTNLANVYLSAAGLYANWSYFDMNFNGASWLATNYTPISLYFILWEHAGNTTSVYTSQDPSAILTDIIENYNSQGGLLTIPSGGYSNTGITTSYTFKVQTVLQAIQTIMGLSPTNWYWYGDPTTGNLVFAQKSTTADITIIKGKHINELEIEATKENIKTTAYFSGGDDGTGTNTNIFVKLQVARGSNRTGLIQLSDNRVNSTSGGVTVAKQLAQAALDANSSRTYMTTLTIEAGLIDPNLFKLGKMIGFAGFGTFADSLLLQIVNVNKQEDQVICQLGSLPPRPTKAIYDTQAALAYLQTVDNPTTPS